MAKIANKLVVVYSTSQQASGMLPKLHNAIFIRHQFLIKQIAAKLGVATDTILPVSGSLSEQNQQITLGNRALLLAVMDTLGIRRIKSSLSMAALCSKIEIPYERVKIH